MDKSLGNYPTSTLLAALGKEKTEVTADAVAEVILRRKDISVRTIVFLMGKLHNGQKAKAFQRLRGMSLESKEFRYVADNIGKVLSPSLNAEVVEFLFLRKGELTNSHMMTLFRYSTSDVRLLIWREFERRQLKVREVLVLRRYCDRAYIKKWELLRDASLLARKAARSAASRKAAQTRRQHAAHSMVA